MGGAMDVRSHHPALPIAATFAAIGMLSLMDAFMKSASIAVGAYSAMMVRSALGFAVIGPVWRLTGGRWPEAGVVRIHVIRGLVGAGMAFSFFFALVRLPLAEGIAISFIAPLIALYLAALMLHERIAPRAVIAAVLGLAGVVVIVGERIGRGPTSDDAALGIAAVLVSAVLYAFNLVLARKQALLARPLEVTAFQNGTVAIALALGAPWLLVVPGAHAFGDIAASAAIAVVSGTMLAWSYARAEAQVLVPIEYSAFLWAALFGWLFFREPVHSGTIAGAVLIVIGCWIGTRKGAPAPIEQTVV
jgi:S-adenosylmethionine uptake transporter